MWEKNGDDCIVDKRHKVKYFVTIAMISQDEYEQRVEDFFDTVEEAKAALAERFVQLKAEDDEEPWEIDDDGNAYNNVTGERIFVTVTVLKQERGCGGHRKNLGDFKTTGEAEDFIKKLVDELNAEGTQ